MRYIEFASDRPLDVIPLGRLAIDFNPIDYFKPWEECESFKKYVGGSPANIAVGLARLGKKVGFIGCISDDQMGNYCEAYFKKEKIDTSHIMRAKNGESLGLTFTEIISESESRLIMYRDHVADLQLEPEAVDEAYISSAKMLVVSGTALAKSPSREAALKAMEYARKNKTVVVFDIDYRGYTWRGKDEIALYYTMAGRLADVIMGSKEEYDLMDGLLHSELSDEDTAKRWFGEKARIVVIKHGKDGSTAFTADGEAYRIKPFPIKALKSFGGGDGYGSSFLNGLLEGWDIIDCLEYGSASAAMLVASHGCSADMPALHQIEEFITKEKEQYGEMLVSR